MDTNEALKVRLAKKSASKWEDKYKSWNFVRYGNPGVRFRDAQGERVKKNLPKKYLFYGILLK